MSIWCRLVIFQFICFPLFCVKCQIYKIYVYQWNLLWKNENNEKKLISKVKTVSQTILLTYSWTCRVILIAVRYQKVIEMLIKLRSPKVQRQVTTNERENNEMKTCNKNICCEILKATEKPKRTLSVGILFFSIIWTCMRTNRFKCIKK